MTIAHAPFFQALGSATQGDAVWQSTLAGLDVLRLIDSFSENASAAAATQSMSIASARFTAQTISSGNPARAILLRILNSIETEGCLTVEAGRDTILYGRSLDLEGRWSLASDVFKTVVESFKQLDQTEIVIEASTALGAAARNTGDWNTSDNGYARAQYLADVIGHRPLALTVRVGVAGSHMARGNLPAAQEELDFVLTEARAHNFQSVEAIALHAKASVAHLRGEFQSAVHLAYRSLELTTNGSARDRVLADIAAAYAELGMRDAARAGYSIVVLSSPHQSVRWQNTVNLMELATLDRDEKMFDEYVGQLETAALDTRLKAYFLYYRGLGLRTFCRDGAEEVLAQARDHASANKLNQLAFEIERTLEAADSPATQTGPEFTRPSGELQRIAEVLEHLRDASLESTAMEGAGAA